MSPIPSLLDAHEIHEVAVLVATSSSPSSSVTGSPHPERDTRSSLGSSQSHGTLTVKFAPLPHIDPSRKRSLAPLGVSARKRRKQVVQQEGRSLVWSADPDVPEENMEDPIITFAKFVKKTGQTFWRRVRKGNKTPPQEDGVSCSSEPVLDIRPVVRSSERVWEVVAGEVKRGRRASWSPSGERRTLGQGLRAKRRSTSDLLAA